MTNLEIMTKTHFEKLSIIDSGRLARWEYLSKERKLFWMQEVLNISNIYHDTLRNILRPIPDNAGGNTSWGKGYYEGIRAERTKFITELKEIHVNFKEDYKEFKESN